MTRLFSVRITLTVLLLSARLAPAAQWVDWEWVNPLPQGRDLNAIMSVTGGGAVAVGDGGTIMVLGDDGWQMAMTGKEYNLLDVTTDGEIFVAVGGTFVNLGDGLRPSDAYILSSRDGITWTERFRDYHDAIPESVIHDGEKFVALGSWFLAISFDGIHWEKHALSDELMAYGIGKMAWNGSRIVAAAAYPLGMRGWGPRAILVSDDGLNWQAVELPDEIPPTGLSRSVVWGNGRFVVPIDHGVMTSPDGIAWAMNAGLFGSYWIRLVYEGGVFVAILQDRYEPVGVAHSTDGLSWTFFDPGFEFDRVMYDIAWVGDHYEGVGPAGLMATSVDGIQWTETITTTVDFDARFTDLAKSDDRSTLVAVGEQLTVATSEDGTHWASQQLPSIFLGSTLHKARWVNGEFWAVGQMGMLSRSPDGTSWERARAENHLSTFYDIAGNDEVLVAVGFNWNSNGSLILTSRDGGEIWSSQNLPISGNGLTHIAWWGGQFIAFGNGGLFMKSEDGTDWQTGELGGIASFKNLAWNPTEMVIVASTSGFADDVLLTTTDGTSFEVAEPPIKRLYDITWTGNLFVAVGYEGIITSSDGHQWIAEDVGLGWAYRSRCIEGRGTELYVAGIHGSILRARNVATAPRRPGGRVH